MSQFRIRLGFISILTALLCVVVMMRLFSVQVLDGQKYAARSKNQTQQRRILTARRGSILDRRGRVLAASMQSRLSLKAEVIGAPGTNRTASDLRRVYPLGDIAGPVLGYVGKDGYGLGGVEFFFDNMLRGEDGWTIVQKDGRNHRYRKIGLPSKPPRDGSDIFLTIDMDIQKIVQTVLKQTVERLLARGGMCIVMDPQSGKILAMANEPSFNPNLPGSYALAERQNRCISTIYEPGSTFKLVTAASAVQEGIKQETDILFGGNGVYMVYDQAIRDHHPYGNLTFAEALNVSSNVCFAKLSNDIGNERLYRYTRDFGFGTRSGIDLPGEEEGIVHPVRSWSGRTRVTMAIGQEISVTLMQMMLPFAAVANGGILVRPRIYEKIVSSGGDVVDSTNFSAVRRILDEKNARRMRMMLADVVAKGTGKNAAIDQISIAGKTGTSQKLDSGTYSQSLSWSSFIGFLPADNPLLLCSVVIDEPAAGEMGGVAAAPAFKKIMTQIISHPELEFAEKILKSPAVREAADDTLQVQTIPQLCGLFRNSAMSKLDSAGIRASVFGKGDTVRIQIPTAGTKCSKGVRVALYTGLYTGNANAAVAPAAIPDCVGKDLRDAVNMLHLQGLTPYAIGAGTVRRQAPLAGELTRSAQPCTLVCSFEG